MLFRWVVAVCLLWICTKQKVNMMDQDCVPKVYKKCNDSTNICYTIETADKCKLTWNDAKRKCEKNATIREGKLAIINTQDIHAFLAASGWFLVGSMGNANGHSKYGEPEMFIGLRRMSGVWTWLDNSTITSYDNWKGGEPKDDHHCATVKKDGHNVNWKSKNCEDARKNYICQYKNYCPAGYGGDQCIMCDIGTYKESAGNDQCNTCESTRTTIGKGSDDANDCVCKRGYQGSSCTECDIGFYKNRTGPGECTTCGAGRTTTSMASESRANCVCKSGYTGSNCDACPVGKYKEGRGPGNCKTCGTKRTTISEAATHISQCVCKTGRGGSNCAKCAIGTYKSEKGNHSCTSCGQGRTTVSRESTNETLCVCDRGHSGNNCTACPVGFYKITTGSDPCLMCGTGRTTLSTASDVKADCICSSGHTGSSCTPCERGKYKLTNGSDSCVSCGSGRTTDTIGATSESFCVCEAGHGGTACAKCAKGSYKSNTGSDNCIECDGGLTTLSMGATRSSQCVLENIPTCSLAEELMNNHIVPPQFTTVALNQTVTLGCESGWTYRNSDTSRTLTCTGSDTWNQAEQACEVNTVCAAIPEEDRVDCGWDGISRLECEANMCCYSSSGSSGSAPCYFKESRNTIVNVENGTCTFHGKKYSFVSSAGAMNINCPSDHPRLVSLGYEAEFHLLRICLSLLETTEGMIAVDRRIEGRTTSLSDHITDLEDYYPQPGTDDNCVTMSTRTANEADEAGPVNLFKKECAQSAFPICFKHLDVMTLLVSHPVNDGSCKVFDIGDYPDISLWQTFTITDPTFKGYSLLRYKMEGLQCEDITLLFSTTKGNATTCKKNRSCEVVKEMPQSEECFWMCPCDEEHCQSTVVVEPMINQNQWRLCLLRLA